jgi:hypothetical protein
MLKDFFWDTFKDSGNIQAYIFYKELDELDKVKTESFKNKEEIDIKIS